MKFYVLYDNKFRYFKNLKTAESLALKLLKNKKIKNIEYGVFDSVEWNGCSTIASLRFGGM